MKRTLGIDLGTYNSSAALAIDGKVIMVESKNGRSLCGKNFPSFILFNKLGDIQSVGEPAKRMGAINPQLVVWGFKRLVGISMEEVLKNGELNLFKYPVSKDSFGNIHIPIGSKIYKPQDLLKIMLQEIKEDAENEQINPMTGGSTFENVVITVPAYFKAFRTQPVIDAAKAAGFKKIDILAEPTAAAIRYGYDLKKESLLLAFDIGAGTLDVSLLQIQKEQGRYVSSETGTSGNERFGGIDIDKILTECLSKQLGISNDPSSRSTFRVEVEKAKIRLSVTEKTTLELPDLRTIEFSRDQLEKIVEPLLNSKLRSPLKRVFDASGRSAKEIDHVIFIGGPVNMPVVRRIVLDELKQLGLREEVQREIKNLDNKFPIDPMDSVAQGAALFAADILKPVNRVLAEGYGTIMGFDRYAPITVPNASYPIFGSVQLQTPMQEKRLPISIVAKVPNIELSNSYKYQHLGLFCLAINSNGQPPIIDIKLTVEEDKSVTAQLTHMQTGQKTIYHALNFLTGNEISLKEEPITEEEEEKIITEIYKSMTQKMSAMKWLEVDLDCVINAAKSLLTECHNCNPSLKKEYQELSEAVTKALKEKNPGQNGPDVWNKSQTYLSILLSCQEIDESEYNYRKMMLDRILE